jgi:hypothetical protein
LRVLAERERLDRVLRTTLASRAQALNTKGAL